LGIFVMALAYFYVLAMQGDETENKDIMNQDESLMDIDSADSGNPLAATEYVEELYKFYRENEVDISNAQMLYI
jgi:hypothetical protein